MKQHAAIVIAALMITSIAFAISATSVTATHEQTPEIDETTVKGDTSMILTITINNAGPAAIDNVRITLPSGFTNFAPTIKIPKDNLVELMPEKVVTLKAGTIVKPAGSPTVVVLEDTPGIRLDGTQVWRVRTDVTNENYKLVTLLENASVEVWPSGGTATGLGATDNIELNEPIEVTLLVENEVRLVNDTQVVLVSGNEVRLPGDTLVELVAATANTDDNLAGENVTLQNDVTLTLTDNSVRLTASVVVEGTGDATGSQLTIGPPGDNELELYPTNEVVVSAGTVVRLNSITAVTVEENTEMIVVAEKNVVMSAGTESENQPKNWMQYDDTPGTQSIEWKGIDENQIASGASLEFPFAVKTPDISGDYTILVRTKDTENRIWVEEVTVTVDATLPTVELAVSPEWAKANTDITITVTADEPLAKLDNVMVAENENTENIQVTMEPNADNTVWTGTYTTTDNENRDGPAKVWVIGTQLKDLVGNTGSNENATFCVDKLKPPTPDVMSLIYGWTEATKKYTNDGTWLIEGYSEDNYLGVKDYTEGMTVKVRVGTTTYTLTSGVGGYFYKSITLTEGVQEVGIQYIDPVGNMGTENAENITYDATKPSISITSPENGAIINDNTPTIKLTISDVVMGIENDVFDNINNTGYTVWLCKDDDTLIGQLTSRADPAEDPIMSFVFENDYPDELVENWYKINVAAGDNIQQENTYFRFKVDVTAPTMPSALNAANNPILYDTTVAEPKMQKEIKLVLYGSGLEKLCDVKVYLVDQATGETISTETTTADATGGFNKSLTLVGGKTIRIEVETTDEAGNVSLKSVYGYVMTDATAPVVTLEALPGTTDETSAILSGTVTKDTWEDWSDITLTVQVGIGSVDVQIGAEGGYSCSVPLSMGVNTIAVRATDSIGNASIPATATVERVVSMDTSAPGVTLEALPEATGKASITISGTVVKDAWESWSDITLTVQVGIGRVEVPIGAGGSYSYSIELAEGANTIAVQATDAVGNAGTAAYATVERTVTPWGTYAIVFVIIALVIAAIAIFRGPKIWKR